jgi:hypothetical protein
MRKAIPSVAFYAALPILLVLAASSQRALAQEHSLHFVCLAPAGHVCQYVVLTAAGPVNFSLPSGERRDVGDITPRRDKYCVCAPGPVTDDSTAPQLRHWCLGYWADVVPAKDSENRVILLHYAQQ